MLKRVSQINSRFKFPVSGFKLFDFSVDVIKKKETKHSERAINQLPEKRNSADGSADKCQWKDHHTRNHPKLNYPDVFDWVFVWPDERNSNHNVCEGKPVGAVSHERIFLIGICDGSVNIEIPPRDRIVRWKIIHKSASKVKLPFNRKRGDSADNKKYYENKDKETDLL